jgi:hypothetical protein
MEASPAGAVALPGSPPELEFRVDDAGPLEHAAAPALRFSLVVNCPGGPRIQSVMLDVQLQIAPRRRAYDAPTERRLFELFGEPERWGSTLRTLLWSRTTMVIPGFEAHTAVDLVVPCTYDFGVSASGYLDAIREGAIPLELLFSGTFFYAGPDGRLQIGRIGWDQEAHYELPARVWHETMDRHFPNSAWLRLHKDTFDRLHAYRSAGALISWEAAIDALLDGHEEGSR